MSSRDLIRKDWPNLAALADELDDINGRQVAINHTIEHVDRRETVTRTESPALERARKHREKQFVAGL